MADFKVEISMDTNTLNKLKDGGYKLFGFKAVQVSVKGGVPLVWFSTDEYLTTTSVQWEESYEAYISTQVSPSQGTTIIASNTASIDLGNTMNVTKNGAVDVETTGQAGSISVVAELGKQWTTGINQLVQGKTQPLCAIPLFGGNLNIITPRQKVLLMFATAPYSTGTVIVQSFSSGILVDFTGGFDNRQVTYEINNGWGPTTQTWAKIIPVSTELTPLLIGS